MAYIVQSCRIAVWNNIDITERHTILHDYSNTITLQESDRILLVRQANTEESGIYVVRGGYLTKSNDPHDNQDGTCTFIEESQESFIRHNGVWVVFQSPGVLYADASALVYHEKDYTATIIQKWRRKRLYTPTLQARIRKFILNRSIVHVGYMPPIPDLPVLKHGGFHYRETAETTTYRQKIETLIS